MSVRSLAKVSFTAACLSLAIAGLPSLSYAVGSSDPNAEYFEKAKQAFSKGDANAALIHLKNAVRNNPEDGAARFELGAMYYRTGDYPSAEKELKAALDRKFARDKVLPVLAQTYLNQNKPQQALDLPIDGAEGEFKARMLSARSRALAELKRMDEAQKTAEEAYAAAPNLIEVKLVLSRLLQVKGDLSRAEALTDEALATSPNSLEAQLSKAELRRMQNDGPGALTYLNKVLDQQPNNILARLSSAIILIAGNKDKEADQHLDKVLAQAPNMPQALYLRAMILSKAKDNAKALEILKPVEAQLQESPRALYLLAMLHGSQGNTEQALGFAQKFHNAEPDSIAGRKLLANVQMSRNQPDKVIELLEPVRDSLDDDVAATTLLGSAYLAKGRQSDASAMFAQAVKLNPNDVQARTRLAYSKSQGEHREEGIKDLEALAAETSQDQLGMLVVMTHLGNNDVDRALSAAESFRQRSPKAALPENLLGMVYLAKSDETKAREAFKAALSKEPDFIPSLLSLAELDLRAKHFDEARGYYDIVLKKQPNDLQALTGLAMLELAKENPDGALPILEKAVAGNPKAIRPRLQIIEILLTQNKLDKARSAAQDLVAAQPKDPNALDALARVQLASKLPLEAIGTYRQIVGLVPNSVPAHSRLAALLIGADRLGEAKTELDKVVSLEPKSLPAWLTRIEVEKRLSGSDAALALARKQRDTDPKEALGHILVGDVLLADKKGAEAEAAFKAAFERAPTADTTLRIYRAVMAQNDQKRARKGLEDWLAKNPKDAVVRLTLADNLLAAKEYKAAAAQYESVAEAVPDNPAVRNNLAWLYGQLNDPRAMENAKKAYDLAPKAPDTIDTYGWMLVKTGDLKQGLALLKEAQGLAPKHPSIGYHLASALYKTDDKAGALELLKPIVEIKEDFEDKADAHKLYESLKGK